MRDCPENTWQRDLRADVEDQEAPRQRTGRPLTNNTVKREEGCASVPVTDIWLFLIVK